MICGEDFGGDGQDETLAAESLSSFFLLPPPRPPPEMQDVQGYFYRESLDIST